MDKRSNKSIFAAGFFALALVFALPASAETLADAMVSAYKTSNLLEQNRAVLRAADEDVATAISSLRPVLNFVAGADYQRPVSPSSDNYSFSVALAAQMTLFSSGRNRLSVDIAKETVLATREALVGIEQNVLLSAVQAYFGVRSAEENVAINDNSVRVLDETLRATQDQFDVGEVTRTDVALAEAQVAAGRAGLAAARGQLSAARESYKAVVGHYPGRLSPAPRTPALPRNVDEAQSVALRTHPNILQAQHQVAAADLGVALGAAQRYPTVTADASVALDDNGNDISSVGVQLRQPIYAGGRLSSVHRQAVAQRDTARAGLQQTGVLVTQNVANSWADIAVARAQIEATDRQIAAATIAYDGVREEAKLGARTTLDVLTAEQSLLDARASQITAVADHQVANYALLAAMGLLTVERLNLGIPVYDPAAYYNAVKNAPPSSVQGATLDRVLKAIGRN
ncbi:MAG TPA: TolC family outer membrane protein [Albidovulum sp.]|uniref:TolC family outer membrane protein n=1 Tax=Albidovulum sp. TaxID=1872424 RepID=UPI002CE5BBA9|nr:TolC family outer membrane protein [Albidovulum sp.]